MRHFLEFGIYDKHMQQEYAERISNTMYIQEFHNSIIVDIVP